MWVDSRTAIGGRHKIRLTINLNINRQTRAFSIWWRGKPVVSLAYKPLGFGYKMIGPFGYAFNWRGK